MALLLLVRLCSHLSEVNNAVAGSTVGVYGKRDMPKPKTVQLTIFYAGSVNVFNNVSAEKAQELMFLASRGSLPSASSTVARNPDAHFPASPKVAAPEVSLAKQMFLQKPQHVSPPVSAMFKPISVVSQAASLLKSASSSNIDSSVLKSSGPVVVAPTSQPPSTHPATVATTTAATIIPRAVTQARKASLRIHFLYSPSVLELSQCSTVLVYRNLVIYNSLHLCSETDTHV